MICVQDTTPSRRGQRPSRCECSSKGREVEEGMYNKGKEQDNNVEARPLHQRSLQPGVRRLAPQNLSQYELLHPRPRSANGSAELPAVGSWKELQEVWEPDRDRSHLPSTLRFAYPGVASGPGPSGGYHAVHCGQCDEVALQRSHSWPHSCSLSSPFCLSSWLFQGVCVSLQAASAPDGLSFRTGGSRPLGACQKCFRTRKTHRSKSLPYVEDDGNS